VRAGHHFAIVATNFEIGGQGVMLAQSAVAEFGQPGEFGPAVILRTD